VNTPGNTFGALSVVYSGKSKDACCVELDRECSRFRAVSFATAMVLFHKTFQQRIFILANGSRRKKISRRGLKYGGKTRGRYNCLSIRLDVRNFTRSGTFLLTKQYSVGSKRSVFV
jgi:hypothetical protein